MKRRTARTEVHCYGGVAGHPSRHALRKTKRPSPQLTLEARLGQSVYVKITGKRQVTIPPAMRKEHQLLPRREVELVDQPDGMHVVKPSKLSRGKRVLAALLRGEKVKGDTEGWLRLTSGAA